MRARYVLTTILVLTGAAASAQAQYRDFDRFHERFRDREHGIAPAFVPPMPAAGEFTDRSLPARHRPERAKAGADGSICDKPDDNPDAAIAACGRIIARGQVKNGYSLVLAYTHRGQAYENQNDHVHAIADFSEAIRRAPLVPGYFALRAVALEKSGDVAAAQDDYRQLVKLDPKNQQARNNLNRIETRSAATVASAEPTAAAATASHPSTTGATGPAVDAATRTSPAVAASPPAPDAASATPAAASSSAQPAKVAPSTMAAAAHTSALRATAPVLAASAAQLTPFVTPLPLNPAAAVPSSAAVAGPPAAPATAQGARVALVIGNGAYVNANVLPNPPNDAHAIAGMLRGIGFDVTEGENLDHATMESDLQAFLHKAEHASVVLLFYAGHGMQVDGKNYLVPVDAKLAEPSDLAFETIEIDKLLDSLGDPGHTNIILLDACRDNPLARSFASHLPAARSIRVATGLAAYSAVGTGTLIAYATAPGQTALDGQGKDSPFTTSLLKYLPTPGLEIRQVLTRVRAEVATATDNRQIPWDNSSLMGDVFLVNAASQAKASGQ